MIHAEHRKLQETVRLLKARRKNSKALIFCNRDQDAHFIAYHVLNSLDQPAAVCGNSTLYDLSWILDFTKGEKAAAISRFLGSATPVLVCSEGGGLRLQNRRADLAVNFDFPGDGAEYLRRAEKASSRGKRSLKAG